TALVFAQGLSGCSGDQQQKRLPEAAADTLRIVSSLPARGHSASEVKRIRQAIDLLLEQNDHKAGNWQVEHLALDDSEDETGDWSRAAEQANAQMAANDPATVAYIGPYNSGAAMISLPITNRAGLLQASPSVTWPGLTESGWNPGEPQIYY